MAQQVRFTGVTTADETLRVDTHPTTDERWDATSCGRVAPFLVAF